MKHIPYNEGLIWYIELGIPRTAAELHVLRAVLFPLGKEGERQRQVVALYKERGRGPKLSFLHRIVETLGAAGIRPTRLARPPMGIPWLRTEPIRSQHLGFFSSCVATQHPTGCERAHFFFFPCCDRTDYELQLRLQWHRLSNGERYCWPRRWI